MGKYGEIRSECTSCDIGLYQDERKQIQCKSCPDGKIPNNQSTACEFPEWKTPQDCSPSVQFLNNTAQDKMEWDCLPCPVGAYCPYHGTIDQLRPLDGHWRVPWSEHNITFLRCPYLSDCIGENETSVNKEGCKFGTTGPLCSLCIDTYHRDASECILCVSEVVPLRIAFFLAIVIIFLLIVNQCRKKIHKKWKKYGPLWEDVIRVISINITFAQINSSLPSVINVEWPEEWTKFLKYFDVVNIDVMSLIGAKCVSDFNYYLSFTIMVCLPAGILIMAVLHYYFSIRLMTHKLSNMTEIQKETKQKEAWHLLFELTDADHSGDVDPMELAEILHSIGWSVKLKQATELAEKIGAHVDEENRHGQLILDEDQFVNSIIDGTLALELEKMNIKSTSNKLTDTDEMVKWVLKSNIISNSLSGATQLLLLAHTPVSRKVFLYFHCHQIAGRSLLYIDYDINCDSTEYYAFIPFVIVVLVTFTIALPAVILVYLFNHRNDLYSTKTHQIIGWLYEPFVRGAEFWEVHDLLMKMILTGMLIYVPPATRAGAAVLVCMISIANLNYFQPHKNVMLFWLTQISFITTALKYTVALLLSAAKNTLEMQIVGTVLIGLDIFFMICSILALILSLVLLRTRMKEIQLVREKSSSLITESKKKKDKESLNNTKVTPTNMEEKTEELNRTDNETDQHMISIKNETESHEIAQKIKEEDKEEEEEDSANYTPHRIASLAFTPEHHLGHFGDHDEARDIHDKFHIHEEGLRNKTEQRQKRAQRRTSIRLVARTKLKDSKALHELATFSHLNDDEVNLFVDNMDHVVRFKGDTICHQHDVSDSFYVIVKGNCIVEVDVEEKGDQTKKETSEIKVDDMEEETRPEQLKVAELKTLDFFGENALLKGDDEQSLRNATVIVASEKCILLRLKKFNFLKLMKINEHTFKDKHDNHKSMLDQMKDTKLERTRSNRLLLMQNRTNSMLTSGSGSGGGGVGGDEQMLVNLDGSSNTKDSRSLFS